MVNVSNDKEKWNSYHRFEYDKATNLKEIVI